MEPAFLARLAILVPIFATLTGLPVSTRIFREDPHAERYYKRAHNITAWASPILIALVGCLKYVGVPVTTGLRPEDEFFGLGTLAIIAWALTFVALALSAHHERTSLQPERVKVR